MPTNEEPKLTKEQPASAGWDADEISLDDAEKITGGGTGLHVKGDGGGSTHSANVYPTGGG